MPHKDAEARKAYNKSYAQKPENKAKARLAQQRYAERNPGKYARFKQNNPDYFKSRHLKSKYGITVEQRDELLESQGNCCAICKSIDPGPKGWHTDHCHKTGRVRGILCNGCNVGLGHFKESVAVLNAAAIEYLFDK